MRTLNKVRGQRKLSINALDCATFSFLLRKLSVDMEMIGDWAVRGG